MFKVKSPILHLFLLKLRVTFDSPLGYVNKSLRVTKILPKKSFKIDPGQWSYLTPTFVLVPAETDPPIKKRCGKRDAIWLNGAGGIEIVLALLAEVVAFHMWLPVIEIWKLCLQLAFLWLFLTIFLEERVHAEFCNSLQVFFGVQGRCKCWRWCLTQSICSAKYRSCFYWCFFGLVWFS